MALAAVAHIGNAEGQEVAAEGGPDQKWKGTELVHTQADSVCVGLAHEQLG